MMADSPQPPAAEAPAATDHSGYHAGMLFLLSCISLVTGAMVFSLRATILEDLGLTFTLDAGQVGAAVGAAFLGFALSVFLGSALCDILGMRVLLGLAAILHIGGALIVISAGALTGVASPYVILWTGMLVVGLAHGLVEAVINPLIATLYPDDKTHKLNVLHAWWPGGLIIGGLLGFGMMKLGMGWQARFGIIVLPSVVYGTMVAVTRFPPTERAAHRVPTGEMWMQSLKPLFIIWFLMMFLTAATELGPGQWVDATLSKTVGFKGILVLVYVSGLMFVLRHFAGPLAHRLSPVGLMWVSSLLAGIGLLLLSAAKSPLPAVLAATVWGAGVCYMWPTMLGVTSERFPKGGAVLMGLMGTAGNLSIYFVLPAMGRIYDHFTQKALGAGVQLHDLIEQAGKKVPGAAEQLDAARTSGAPYAFRYVAAVCIVLVLVFGAVWLYDRARGGYKAVKLTAEPEPEPAASPLPEDKPE
jgi:MFS family permease